MTDLKNAEPHDVAPRRLAIRIPEAIRITGMGKTTIYGLIASGDLAVIKIGRVTLIPVASLEELLERHRHVRGHH
jgi:excisionase family DNA binding protein